MANPTTNYGWPMPTSTDLVTDLPADFAAFGQPVDTSLKALNPETTIGDIAYRSATANTNTRLGIGSAGQVLTVASGVPSWATPASPTFVGASVYKTAAQSTTSGATALITWNAENFDTNAFHDNSTNNSRMTIPTGYGGKYFVTATIYPVPGAGFREIGLYKNNVAVHSWTAVLDTNYASVSFSAVIEAAAADYLELKFYQNSGGALNINSGIETFFIVSYLGA